MEKNIGDLSLSTDPTKLHFNVIHGYLTTSYWSEKISKTRMKRAIENSLNVGAYVNGEQVAYARIITDKATFAYLCDVFVLESHRSKGISKEMMKFIHELPELKNIKRFMLVTRDAHGLYSQFGFQQLKEVAMYMEINRSGIFKTLDE